MACQIEMECRRQGTAWLNLPPLQDAPGFWFLSEQLITLQNGILCLKVEKSYMQDSFIRCGLAQIASAGSLAQ